MLFRNSCDTCSQCLTQHETPKTGKLKTRKLTIMTESNGLEWQNGVVEIEELKKKIGTVGFERFRLYDNVVYTRRK